MRKIKESKICVVCKKPMEWRKSWRNNWQEVKYCSDRCRKNKRVTKSNAPET
ncbi:DUF2256 domain-containing protein [Betaproteobacteria bacterium]|nr:DUF2256 domain-containing protein [Betaproteobacteria bacterium]MDA9719073.1 DUF2256 domain-containing protein [Betaproteobacteria bacterium]